MVSRTNKHSAATAVFMLLVSLTACSASKETYLQRGDQFLAQGKTEDAILQFRKAIQSDDTYGEAYLRLGMAYRRAGKWQDSFAALTRAVERMRQSTAAKIQVGDLALSGFLADPRRPRRLYDTVHAMAKALAPPNASPFHSLRLRGYLAMTESDIEAAAEFFRKADQINPGQPDVVAALVQTLLAAKHDSDAESRALSLIRSGIAPLR